MGQGGGFRSIQGSAEAKRILKTTRARAAFCIPAVETEADAAEALVGGSGEIQNVAGDRLGGISSEVQAPRLEACSTAGAGKACSQLGVVTRERGVVVHTRRLGEASRACAAALKIELQPGEVEGGAAGRREGEGQIVANVVASCQAGRGRGEREIARAEGRAGCG